MAAGDRGDGIEEDELRPQEPVSPTPLRSDQQPQSSFADDPLARLWQSADGRETGAEAFEALRARQQQERASEKNGGRRRGRRRP